MEDYINVNYVCSMSDRRSTSVYCTFLHGNFVAKRCKKQSVIARSTLKQNLEP